MGERKGEHRVLVGKSEGKNRLDLQEVGVGDMDWILLARERGRWRALVNAALKLRVP